MCWGLTTMHWGLTTIYSHFFTLMYGFSGMEILEIAQHQLDWKLNDLIGYDVKYKCSMLTLSSSHYQ